ncbi:MAG: hypothetical protein HYU64_02205 [Armatimonadetes bacterium]|nr:hypothetical protein [Armatimonadota bacterium]
MTTGTVTSLNGAGLRNANTGTLSRLASLKSESGPSTGDMLIKGGIRGSVDILDTYLALATASVPQAKGAPMLPVQTAAAWVGGVQIFGGVIEGIYGIATTAEAYGNSNEENKGKIAMATGVGDILAGVGLCIQAGTGAPVGMLFTLVGASLSTLGTLGSIMQKG